MGKRNIFAKGAGQLLVICPTCCFWHVLRKSGLVIPGRRNAASFDVQLHIRESVTTIVSMDSGPAPSKSAVADLDIHIAELG
ncbi:MAG: hypothetical protein ACJ8EE_00425 [Bradyrhizobium sp.]